MVQMLNNLLPPELEYLCLLLVSRVALVLILVLGREWTREFERELVTCSTLTPLVVLMTVLWMVAQTVCVVPRVVALESAVVRV